MSAMTGWLLLAGGAALLLGQPRTEASPADKASTAWSSVEFSMKPRDEASHPWTVHLDPKGAGNYSEDGQAGQQPLTISDATLQRIRLGERRAKSGRCETHQKNIARTGEKTIRYISADRTDGCTFNFSDDNGLMDAAGAFEAIAETMQAGERLQHDQRFDRLSLDADMDTLLTGIKNGAAIELNNIAPVLQSLADDDHIIDRVRRKSARLLQDSGSGAAASSLSASDR